MSEMSQNRMDSLGLKSIKYIDAIVEAQREEMGLDDKVILIGEDIAAYGGAGLFEDFGDRLWNTPISENAITGMGVGAAITGLRPVVDLTIASFIYLASDQIINQAAKLRFMTGGQLKVPLVVRASMYYGAGLAAQHSDRPYSMFLNVPGLKVLAPSNATDMKGLMKSAIRDNDPVIIFEDVSLWAKKAPVPEDVNFLVPIGKASVPRSGSDATIIAIGGAVPKALVAAKALESEGIDVEVVDPRTLSPLDTETLISSVVKTGRCVVVDHANHSYGAAAEIAALISEEAFDSLKSPVKRVCTPDVHIPFSPELESPLYPSKEKIIFAVKCTLS